MEHKIVFQSINCDGIIRNWEMTKDELYNEYFNGDCDLPSLDNEILECGIVSSTDSTVIYVETFKDLMNVLFGEY